jgi:hypothetical protein
MTAVVITHSPPCIGGLAEVSTQVKVNYSPERVRKPEIAEIRDLYVTAREDMTCGRVDFGYK